MPVNSSIVVGLHVGRENNGQRCVSTAHTHAIPPWMCVKDTPGVFCTATSAGCMPVQEVGTFSPTWDTSCIIESTAVPASKMTHACQELFGAKFTPVARMGAPLTSNATHKLTNDRTPSRTCSRGPIRRLSSESSSPSTWPLVASPAPARSASSTLWTTRGKHVRGALLACILRIIANEEALVRLKISASFHCVSKSSRKQPSRRASDKSPNCASPLFFPFRSMAVRLLTSNCRQKAFV